MSFTDSVIADTFPVTEGTSSRKAYSMSFSVFRESLKERFPDAEIVVYNPGVTLAQIETLLSLAKNQNRNFFVLLPQYVHPREKKEILLFLGNQVIEYSLAGTLVLSRNKIQKLGI